MLYITKKISIAISFIVFCVGQAYACAVTEVEIDRTNQTVASINTIPVEILPLILAETSKGSLHPINFRLVCAGWKNFMDKDNKPNEKNTLKLHGGFLQKCIDIWEVEGRKLWAFERFNTGVLRYEDPENGEEKLLKFSELKDGTFDFSTWGKVAKYLVITTDVERFFEIEGKNEDKVVALVVLHQGLAPKIHSSAKPFASIMPKWDAAKFPACIAWRWGNHRNLAAFDFLTSASLSEISRNSLYGNWLKSAASVPVCDKRCITACGYGLYLISQIYVNFLNQNKNY